MDLCQVGQNVSMDIETFLSSLENLLLDGQKSPATDLLVEFLLQTHGKPTSLGLPESQILAEKSPAEIVAILRASLCQSSHEQPKPSSDVDWQINTDDFLLIEETAEFISKKTTDYQIDEETVQGTFPYSATKSPIDDSGAFQSNDGAGFRADGDLFSVDHPDGNQKARQAYGFSERMPQRLSEKLDACSQDESVFDDFEAEGCHPEDDFDCDFENDLEVHGLEDHGLDLENFFETGLEVELSDFQLDDLDEAEIFEESDHLLDELPDEDRISISDRALQVAITVGIKFGLRQVDIEFLQQIFIEHGWGNARIAITSLLAKGVKIGDLRRAKQMKDIWSGRREFWIGFYLTRRDTSDYTYESSRILSWAFAVKLLMVFQEDIEIDEIEYYLDELYDIWWSKKRQYYLKFIDYLKDIAEKTVPGELTTEICREYVIDFEEYRNEEVNLYGSPLYKKLKNNGLIPDIWVNEFDQR